MIIGIEASALGNTKNGTGRYIKNLIEAMLKSDTILIVISQHHLDQEIQHQNCRYYKETSKFWRKIPPFFWIRYRLPAIIQYIKMDVFISAITIAPKRLPPSLIHAAIIYDLNHIIVPNTQKLGARIFHCLFFDNDVIRADYLISISEGTAQKVEKYYSKKINRIIRPPIILYQTNGAEISSDVKSIGLKPFLLFVGTIEPRKNIALLIDAFESVQKIGLYSDFKIAFVGAYGWKSRKLLERIKSSPEKYKYLGKVNDEELAYLYKNCFALVLTSIYEGYGMPVAEARLQGAKVMTSNIPELIEAANGEGVFVEPTHAGIKSGLIKLIDFKDSGKSKENCFETSVLEMIADLKSLQSINTKAKNYSIQR